MPNFSFTTDGLEQIITCWKKSTSKGYKNYTADVFSIYYDDVYVYVSSNSIPSYSIGEWKNTPNKPIALNKTYKFLRLPKRATVKYSADMDIIGLWINGLAISNPIQNSKSYNNLNIWHQNSFFWEQDSFDPCLGHPDSKGFIKFCSILLFYLL